MAVGRFSHEETEMIYHIWKSDKDSQWYWHLKAANGKIVAASGQGYHNKQDCLAGIELVKASDASPVQEGE